MDKVTTGDNKIEADLADEADALVNRTAHFVGEWIEDNVIEQPPVVPAGVDVAADFAQRCLEDAKEQGIDAEDIQAEVGDLRDYIAETLADENLLHPVLGPMLPEAAPERKR
jgi:hypothetical protein